MGWVGCHSESAQEDADIVIDEKSLFFIIFFFYRVDFDFVLLLLTESLVVYK